MSAATYQRLREEFVRGWVGLGGKQFTLHIFTPSFSQAGHCPNDPNWKEILPFDRKTDKLIGAVHLPYSANTDDRENFTNTPGSVVVTPSPSFMAAKDAPLFASACELFQQLCEKAGAALPEVIRKRLVGYCTWQCNSPASWWFALLAHIRGLTVYHSDGTYNDHNFISGAWGLSIRLIDYFGLNTDSPTWPEDGTADGEQPTHGPDFRSVKWFGSVYEFTAQQAACVKVLWEAWENGTPAVGDATVLETADSDAERLPLVFRNHPAWGTLIVEGQTKGTHRLADPPKA